MADESLRTPTDPLRLVRLRAADVSSLTTTESGGLRSTRTITDIAAGIPCHGGTSIEDPIGTVATLPVACAMPGVPYGSEGLGVEHDPAAVARFRRN